MAAEIRPVWRDLKAHHLAHQTFTDIAALDQAIHDAVIDLNRERIPDPLALPRISAMKIAYEASASRGLGHATRIYATFSDNGAPPRALIGCLDA